MTDTIKNHIVNIIIDNEFGALARVIELFSARGYNIETLSVAPVSGKKNVSAITITTNCNDKTIALICKLLQRIVPVHTAKQLNSQHISQELVLLKIAESPLFIEDILQHNTACRWRIINPQISQTQTNLELIGDSHNINQIIETFASHKIISIARSGLVAIDL
jgi:acetolactate synthase-1/3 small subunit